MSESIHPTQETVNNTMTSQGEDDSEEVTQLMNTLEGALSQLQKVRVRMPTSHPDRSSLLDKLTEFYELHFSMTGRCSDLDEVVSLHREVLDLHPVSHPDHPSSLNDLATALRQRYEQTGESPDLDEAISLHRETLSLKPVNHPDHAAWVNKLAMALHMRFERLDRLPDLEEAVPLFRQALDFQPASHPDRVSPISNLAASLCTRFTKTGQLSDLEEAIALHRKALALRPASHPHQSSLFNNLAMALHTQFEQTSQPSDLDEAILLFREALALRPASRPSDSSSLRNLATALRTRFERTSQLSDLDEAIALYHEALALLPMSHPGRLSSLSDLSLALGSRFQKTSQLSDLEESISLHREVLLSDPEDHPGHSSELNNLATVLHTRFEQTGQLSDLDEAIALFRRVLVLRPAPHPERSPPLSNLAAALRSRFQRTGHFSELDEAIQLFRESLALRPLSDPDRPPSLSNLAVALATRFEQTNQLEDLEEAISLHRQALGMPPSPNVERSFSLHELAGTLYARFKRTGQLSDLDEAIVLHRSALALRPAFHPDRSASLSNLAIALSTRFEHAGQNTDIEECISLHREALHLRPGSHPARSSSLNNLAGALLMGQLPDLDEVVRLYRGALALRPGSHPGRSSALNNLAVVLANRFEHTGQTTDLDESISLQREALNLWPATHPRHSISLLNLAEVLEAQFQKTGQLHVLDEAIILCRQALPALPEDHPWRMDAFKKLGNCLAARFSKSEEQGIDLEEQFENILESMAAFRSAARCESAAVSERFAAARLWVATAHATDRLHESALEAYETTIGLLPQLAMPGLDLESRQRALSSRTDGLARNAAACAIDHQRIDKAIALLEAGRAIFWSQALQLRTPLNDLELVKPELAQKLTSISRSLEQGAARDVSRTMSDSQEKVMSMEQAAVRYRQLNDKWLVTVEEVRGLDDFQDFLRPKSFSMLSAAAANGPVVILNASTFRSHCDALIMRPSKDPLHVPLPQFTVETAEKLAQSTRTLSGSFPLTRGDRHAHRRHENVGDPDSIFQVVLATLWRSVVQPILISLDLKKSDSPPRLWWLPTGPFASLPMHAAGIYDADGSECISDYVISSYTPTLSTLLIPPPIAAEPFKMLAAIQPATKGQALLPFTQEELRKIEEHVPSKSLAKFGIPGSPAYVEDILSYLPAASIVHLACHGVQDLRKPLDSALLLEDGHLKVSRLMELSMEKASLVFLSACQTAMVGEDLPDEPIHLAATLLFAGFRGAIATMWSIRDHDGPTIAESFYRHLFSTSGSATDNPSSLGSPDTTRAAYALHLAVGELRNKLHAERAPSRYVRWVPFIHMGL